MSDQSPIPEQRPELFSPQFLSLIGEDLGHQITDAICRALTDTPLPPQRPTSLCLEIIVFELDEDLLQELVNCALTHFNPLQIAEEIFRTINHINRILNGYYKNAVQHHQQQGSTHNSSPQTEIPIGSDVNPLPVCKFDVVQMILRRIEHLRCRLLNTCHLRERIFEEILLHPAQLGPGLLQNLEAVVNHVVIQELRENLIDQYDNFALKNCNKVSCINSDLEFIADQIKQFSINFPAGELGIIEIADAAGTVAEAFHSEEHDFAEIFKAVDAVAEVIEDLADFYKVKIDQLEHLLDLTVSGCPVPIEARSTLPSIPELSPTPNVIPIVGIPSSFSSSLTPFTSPITTPTTPIITPPIIP